MINLLASQPYLHDIDPFALYLGWDVLEGVRWYGLSYLLGFLIAYFLIRRVTTHGVSTLKKESVGDFVIAMAIGVIVGGRLGYCVFYKPELLTGFTASFPFWDVLAINKGGMASHGGMIGVLVAAWIYARRWGHRFAHLADIIAFASPIGLFFGRIANFINGELVGRPCPRDFPFAVQFPQDLYTYSPEQLEPLFPILARLAPNAQTLDQQIHALIAAIRNGDPIARAAVQAVLQPRYPSQLFLAVTEGLVVFAVAAVAWYRPRKPFTIAGLFGVTYGLMRILGEFFREPDAHIKGQEFAHYGISRGQLLSVGLVLAGSVLLIIAQRSKAIPMGGWRRIKSETPRKTDAARKADKPHTSQKPDGAASAKTDGSKSDDSKAD